MDLDKKIKLSQGQTEIELPLINLLRLTAIYMGDYLREYRKNHKTEQITEFYNWVVKEKLGVEEAATILL